MKKALLLLLSIFSLAVTQAQDIIIKKTGEEINAKVLELTPDIIKYKRFDYQEGPTISILKAEVFMIKYANGSKEVFNPSKPNIPAGPTPYPDSEINLPEVQPSIKLSGPRIGFTIIGGKEADRLKEEHRINPFLTQFGWQFETRMFTTENGLSGLAEFVPLIGGLEQGKFLPSLNGLVGLRGKKGTEFGVGPNLSVAGVGLVFAFGTTFHSQGINFPLNLAVVPSNDGVRFSLLFGFNSRKQ